MTMCIHTHAQLGMFHTADSVRRAAVSWKNVLTTTNEGTNSSSTEATE